MTFEKAAAVVMKNEGGYVNDPDDPGGETKWGISKRSYPELRIKFLTEDQARSIYFRDFWIPGKMLMLPVRLRLIFLDMALHQGLRGATLTLQRAINGDGGNLKVDGVIGEKTLAASMYLEVDRLRAYRVFRLARIAIKKKTMMKYWYGWFRRAVMV